MTKLSTEQMLYLLYALAYAEDGSVTQGIVRGHLPAQMKSKADQICDSLCKKELLESPKRRRILLTVEGKEALISNLKVTDYMFDSSKGKKLINTLLHCFKLISSQASLDSTSQEEMDFDTFVMKLKELYLQERKQQELQGVVAIRSRDIYEAFMANNSIPQSLWDKYFTILKSSGQIFAVTEKNEEIIQWGSN